MPRQLRQVRRFRTPVRAGVYARAGQVFSDWARSSAGRRVARAGQRQFREMFSGVRRKLNFGGSTSVKAAPRSQFVQKRASIINVQPSGSRQVVATKNRQVRGRKRIPKVGRKFAKKVKAVLDRNVVTGVYSNRTFNSQAVRFADKQEIYGGDIGGSGEKLFNPNRVLFAASVLWHTAVAGRSMGTFVGDNYFSNKTAVINVLNSYSKFSFKNNMRRTVEVEIISLIPKNNTVGAVADYPIGTWIDCVADDVAAGIAKAGASGAGVTSPAYVEDWGAKPGMTSGFARAFKYTTRVISLEPGQNFVHTIQGPKHVKYDFSKFQNTTAGGMYDSVKGFTQYVMFILRPDLVGSSAGDVGHLAAPAYQGEVVVVEREDQFVLGMPEQAGFTGLVGTASTLNLRRKAYCHNTWQDPIIGTVRRIDELNPLSTQTFT